MTAAATAIGAAYLLDRVGLAIHPTASLALALVAGSAWLWRRPGDPGNPLAFVAVTIGVFVSLLAVQWPALMPPGGGSDLTHHLQLIGFIDGQWRLPHDPAAAVIVGGMINYTPGSHLLAALAGAWFNTDGLHALYPVLAASVAVKAGLLFLIARRMLADDPARVPMAIAAVALPALAFDSSLGSFFRWSFVAQVVAETFAVAMWWALVVWDQQRTVTAAWLFGIAGAATFLCWPVSVGPPQLALALVVLIRSEAGVRSRVASLAAAVAPVAIAGVVHASGRVATVSILQTGGASFDWAAARFGWFLLIASAAGLLMSIRRREARATTLVLGATLAQAAVLFVVARESGADSPYMARKMAHFAVLPMAALAALPVAALHRGLARAAQGLTRSNTPSVRMTAWIGAMLLIAVVARSLSMVPRSLPVITDELARAGAWARTHVPPACIDYLVRSDDTSYWLHHAALGNPVRPRPGDPEPQFFYRDVVARWINGGGLPYAIADLAIVPREVRDDLEPLARYGSIVIGRRRVGGRCRSE